MNIRETDQWAQLLCNVSKDIDTLISGNGHHSVRVAYWVESIARKLNMCEDDIHALRTLGFDDRAIHDATQVIAYFNYINRIADALHVEAEDFIRPWEKSPHVP